MSDMTDVQSQSRFYSSAFTKAMAPYLLSVTAGKRWKARIIGSHKITLDESIGMQFLKANK